MIYDQVIKPGEKVIVGTIDYPTVLRAIKPLTEVLNPGRFRRELTFDDYMKYFNGGE